MHDDCIIIYYYWMGVVRCSLLVFKQLIGLVTLVPPDEHSPPLTFHLSPGTSPTAPCALESSARTSGSSQEAEGFVPDHWTVMMKDCCYELQMLCTSIHVLSKPAHVWIVVH